MFFTAQFKSKSLLAVTHIDGTRVQSVGGRCGVIRKVIESLNHKTGVPVALNISFNGPGDRAATQVAPILPLRSERTEKPTAEGNQKNQSTTKNRKKPK